MSDDIDTMDRIALRNECLALKEKLRVAVEDLEKILGRVSVLIRNGNRTLNHDQCVELEKVVAKIKGGE